MSVFFSWFFVCFCLWPFKTSYWLRPVSHFPFFFSFFGSRGGGISINLGYKGGGGAPEKILAKYGGHQVLQELPVKSHQPPQPPSPPQKRTVPDVPARPHKYVVPRPLFIWCERVRGAFLFITSALKKISSCKHQNNMTSLWKRSSMKRSPITTPKEANTCITSAAEETVQFDDDTLRGEKNALCFL